MNRVSPRQPTKESGITLLELMIVTAIIGVLATLMLPSYQSYLKKARFTEVIIATASHRIAVETAVQVQLISDLKSINAGQLGIPPDINFGRGHLASLITKDGKIIAKGSEAVDSLTYIISPKLDSAGLISIPLEWQVSGSCQSMGLC